MEQHDAHDRNSGHDRVRTTPVVAASEGAVSAHVPVIHRTRHELLRLGSAVLAGGLVLGAAGRVLREPITRADDPLLVPIARAVLPTPTATPAPTPVPRRSVHRAAAVNPIPAEPDSLDIALAASLGNRWRTVEAPRLVATLRREADAWGEDLDLPLLLSISASETAGRILSISPTGAVGPYQLMPAEALHDPSTPVLLTADDALGLRAYITKKPLADAMRIVRLLGTSRAAPDTARERAFRQLDVAKAVRRDGFDDLSRLAPHAPEGFLDEAERLDSVNAEVLRELEQLLSGGAQKAELEQFALGLRRSYHGRLEEQRASWARASKKLTKRRDALIRRYPRSYDQYRLAEELAKHDVRFSPTAAFPLFIGTLERKRNDAVILRTILEEDADLPPVPDPLQIRLYNAGLGTTARRKIGLLESRENDLYEKRVLRLVEQLSSELKRLRLEP